MFESFSAFFGGSPTSDAPSPPTTPAKAPPRPKLGVALGGGGARGWAHIGVLKRLVERGIEPDIIAGTSIGAVAGGCYVAGKIHELDEFARSLSKRRVLGLLDISLGGSGLISGRKLADLLEFHLAESRIEALPRAFVAVATELGTGHEIWLKRGPLVDAMRASYAIPGIFEPINVGGRWLIDGAFVNPVPVSVCRALGARVVVAVAIHGDSFGRGITITEPTAAEEAMQAQVGDIVGETRARTPDSLVRRKLVGRPKGAPSFSAVMVEAFNITQDRIARSRLAGDPPDVSISPRLGKVGLFDFDTAAETIRAGEEAVDKALADIEAAMAALA